MGRHKLRYMLSWLSFALVSIVMICIFSLSTCVKDGVIRQMETNPLSYQVHMQNRRMVDGEIRADLSETMCKQIAEELGAKEFRMLYDTEFIPERIDGTQIDMPVTIKAYNAEHALLLENEVAGDGILCNGSPVGYNGENTAIVTTDFLEVCGYDMQTIIGKELMLKDEAGVEYGFTVAAVMYNIDSKATLANASVYLAYAPEFGWGGRMKEQQASIVTFDFTNDTDMAVIREKVSVYGYPYASEEVRAEKLQVMADNYSSIGWTLGVVMAVISAMSLINSVMITINENASFMRMFRLMGLTRSDYRYLVCFTAAVQGFIGGGIGCVFSVLTQNQIGKLIQSFDLQFYQETSMNFVVDVKVAFLIMLLCTAVSVLAGMLSFFLSAEKTTAIVAENELV